MKLRFAAAAAALLVVPCRGESPVSPPVLEFAIGLPGKQARLDWASESGVRYIIEKSTDLGAGSGGGGGWTKAAVVEATGPSSAWTDPIPTDIRAFYRITLPQAQVFSIAEPALSSSGGVLVVAGQCLPDGSFLTLEIDGVGLVSAALVSSGPGHWSANFAGVFAPGSKVLSVAVTDGSGVEICPIDVDISITETGFAADAPPNSLPPAAPVPMQKNIIVPGVGTVIKKHPGNMAARSGPGDYLDDDDDGDTVPTNASIPVPGVGIIIKKYAPNGMLNRWGDDCDDGNDDPRDASSVRLAPGRNGMPGEACLEYDALTFVCPAGPPLTWTMTYRSMAEVSSGHGPGWDFAYNIFIDAASSTAPTVVVHDGAGRADTFRRASDGTYRADGFSRVGRFSGDVFTLTFANGGTWTFHAIDGTVSSGKIETITDPNGNALGCSYDGSGAIAEVEDGFGHDLSVSWSGGRISSVTDHTGRSVTFGYFAALESGGSEGDLKSIGCPTASGLPPEAGATTFTYSTGTGTPRLDGNLLSVTDGAGRVLESLTYATTTTATDLDFDTLVTQSAHELGHNLGMCHDADPSGRRVVYENDELGRVTETIFDRMHRPLIHRIHNGFHTVPGGTVSPSDFPLAGKTRSTDPDYFETTWTYNADSNVTSLTGADGSKMLTTYQRDLDASSPVIERGNSRVQTLVSSLGEKRSITMEYEPNTGTPECARPGNPIGGLTIKVGKNPGGNPSARPGNPIGGLNIKVGGPRHTTTRRRVEVLKSNKQGDPDANRYDFGTAKPGFTTRRRVEVLKSNKQGDPDANRYDFGTDASPALAAWFTKKGYDYYKATTSKVGEGAFGRVFLGLRGDPDDDNDTIPTIEDGFASASSRRSDDIGYRVNRDVSLVTRLTTSHGQSFTWTYDANGNCTAMSSPVSGGGAVFVYDAQGRLTSSTLSNGAAGDFHDELTYGPDGFLHTYTEDATPGGRNLTTTFEYDTLGRCTRVVDPMTDDWLLTWSALDVCTQTESPPVAGERIATDFAYDASGRLARCDVQLRDSFGNVPPANASYSTFWVYDFRGRLSQVATEERPADTTGLLEPDPLTLENFAVTDFTYDDAGQLARASTPAACRNQSSDAIVDLTYDERGMVHRVVAGGLGTPGAVTTEYDYDTLGTCVREACLAPDGGETLYTYDAFHRPASVTDAMGNEAVFTYDEAGRVTTSVYGEIEDAPSSSGNVLLARTSAEYGNNENWSFEGGGIAGKQSKGRKTVMARDIVKDHLFTRPRRGQMKDKSLYEWFRSCPPDRPVRCGDGACAAFFAVYQEDDVIETERFSPGSPTSELETTVLDRSPAGLLMSVTRNGDLLDSYSYDTNGSLSSIANAARTVDFNRDGREDVVQCTVNNIIKVTLPPPNMALVHTVSRDSIGRITGVTDGAGNASGFEYDSLGRVTSATSPGRPPLVFAWDSADVAGPYSVLVSCDIDNTGAVTELGRALVRCGVPVSDSDSNGYQESLTYDALGRLTARDLRDGTIDGCDYDARGFVSSITHQDGSVTTFANDPLGRTTLVSHSGLPAGIVASGDTNYSYDGLGRLVTASQGSSLVTMTWDSVGNPTSETSDGLTVSRTFNHRGRTSVTYPDSTIISETRNELGQLTNAGGNLIRYVGMRVYQTEQANGVVTTYSYRGEGDSSPPGDSSYGSCVRVTTNSGATTLADVTIQHSPDQLVTKARTLFSAETTGPGRTRTYTYDGLGRVTGCLTERRETIGGPIVTESDVAYTLDAAGRRLNVTGGAHPGSYTQSPTLPPGDHQMGQYTTWPGGNLEWDDRGNLGLFTHDLDALDLDSDGDGRLVAINDAATGLPRISYTYDALGRLATRTEHDNVNGLPPVTTTIVYDGPTVIQELDDPNGTGELSAALSFVNAGPGMRPCISTRNGTYYYPIGSHRRLAPAAEPRAACPVLGITGENGVVLERYDQDEAGEVLLLDDNGLAKSSEIGPVRWMAPEALNERGHSFFLHAGGAYSSRLGVEVEKPKFTAEMGQVHATR